MKKDIVYKSTVLSLVAQVVLGLVTYIGYLFGVPKHLEDDLFPIFLLELSSQLIEVLWYLIVVVLQKKITTWTRYIDWFFSTPVMLFSTVLFFIHRGEGEYDEFLRSGRLYMIVMFNWLMLSFGFAMELETISRAVGIGLGTAMLIATFATMASFLTDDVLSVTLFVAMFSVWLLYGVAAAFPYKEKNVTYNVLDIVSKNFYGLFLTVYAFAV